MINEYDKVKIRRNGIFGKVVDIHTANGETVFIVESSEKGVPGGYGPADGWKLFDCAEDELEKID